MEKFHILLVILLLISICTGCQSGPAVNEKVEPKQVEVLREVVATKLIGSEEKYVYTVGDNLTLNEQGMIIGADKRYDIFLWEYDNAGQLIKSVETSKESGGVSTESWAYEEGVPISREFVSGGFYSHSTGSYEVEKDADGKVVSVTENIIFTDYDDGSKSERTIKIEFCYSDMGYVREIAYYSNDKLDHTAIMDYNDNGNMVSFACYAGPGSMEGQEYLKWELTYQLVDSGTFEPVQLDPFIYFRNCNEVFVEL